MFNKKQEEQNKQIIESLKRIETKQDQILNGLYIVSQDIEKLKQNPKRNYFG